MPPPVEEQRRLINQDLYNELRYLLIAATIWQRCRDVEQSDDQTPFDDLPHHLQALTMDSACMHARALYEFFFKSGDIETASAKRDYGVTLNRTRLYRDYEHTLNKRLFHIDLRRPAPRERFATARVKRNVNRKPKLFADDVLGLWDKLAAQLPQLHRQLSGARKKAIAEADKAAKSVGGEVIFK